MLRKKSAQIRSFFLVNIFQNSKSIRRFTVNFWRFLEIYQQTGALLKKEYAITFSWNILQQQFVGMLLGNCLCPFQQQLPGVAPGSCPELSSISSTKYFQLLYLLGSHNENKAFLLVLCYLRHFLLHQENGAIHFLYEVQVLRFTHLLNYFFNPLSANFIKWSNIQTIRGHIDDELFECV